MGKTEDYLEIRELTARYNVTFDSGDVEGWLECFTDDMVFVLNGKEVGRGIPAMREFCHKMQRTLKVRHFTTDAIIRVEGNTATQDAYLMVIDVSKGSQFKSSGAYADQLRRVNGQWKFSKRVATLDGDLD